MATQYGQYEQYDRYRQDALYREEDPYREDDRFAPDDRPGGAYGRRGGGAPASVACRTARAAHGAPLA